MKRVVIVYSIYTSLFLCMIAYGVWSYKSGNSNLDELSLVHKAQTFISHAEEFDLVFVGDSRTYCAIQPELIDSYLGTHSFNMAHFSNWLPTQYPVLLDIVPSLKSGTVMYWSVGRQNFTGSKVTAVYPIPVDQVATYLNTGFSFSEIEENIGANTSFLWLFHDRPYVYNYIQYILKKTIYNTSVVQAADGKKNDAVSETNMNDLFSQYSKNPEVFHIQNVYAPDGHLTSLALHKKRGSYERVELDSLFFRERQNEASGSIKDTHWLPSPKSLQLFRIMLQYLHKNNVRLVVGTFDEGPHMYADAGIQETMNDELMRFLQKELKPYGFPLLEIDFSQLKADDYFDYNHLNSKGIMKYTPMLTQKLRPYLRQGGEGE